MKLVLFYLAVGLFFTHELDAMTNHEWRVLPLTSWMSEDIGKLVFVLIHIPLFSILVALIASERPIVRSRSWFWVSVFLVVHGLLHAAFTIHEQYEFDTWLSHVLIYGAALAAAGYLAINKSTGANNV